MASASPIQNLDVIGLSSFLLSEGFSGTVADSFEDHDIDGASFLLMTNEHLKEVAPNLIDRIKLQKIQADGQLAGKVFLYISLNSNLLAI